MPSGPVVVLGRANSVIAPAGVIRPTLPADSSVNQMLPSGPAAMLSAPLLAVGIGCSVMTPAGVMLPIRLPPTPSANHRLPSAPAAIPCGSEEGLGRVNSVKAPEVVTRPTRLPADSANHRAPSGPAARPIGLLLAVGIACSVTVGVSALADWTAPSANAAAPANETARRSRRGLMRTPRRERSGAPLP